MCNPVTIFMPAVSREHQPSWRGFAAAACACAAAAVSTQMFLCPFPKCSPKCRDFSRGNKSTCTHRAFWTLFSHWFLNKSWCSLVNLSSQEWVEGFRDWTKPRRQSKPKLKAPAPVLRQGQGVSCRGFLEEMVGAPPKESPRELCMAPGHT